jgi:hypothetical protein
MAGRSCTRLTPFLTVTLSRLTMPFHHSSRLVALCCSKIEAPFVPATRHNDWVVLEL